jgi:hypothetical protein
LIRWWASPICSTVRKAKSQTTDWRFILYTSIYPWEVTQWQAHSATECCGFFAQDPPGIPPSLENPWKSHR